MVENKTKSRQLFESILEQIKNGELQPGDKLKSERTLMQEYGVSRSSIREAIGALNKMGIIVTEQRNGNYVNDKSPDMLTKVLEIYLILDNHLSIDFMFLRREIEENAAYLAALNATEEEIEHMKELHNKRCDLENITKEDLYDLDRELHLAIAKASHNRAFELFIEAIFGVLKAHQFKVSNRANVKVVTNRYHGKIIAAIENKEATLAKRHMRKHIEHLIRVLEKIEKKKKQEK
ncbi:hypothetical protein AN639_03545 [Candidatus Epulonipiscium fishelsonii]|uniref:Uncharacterized protein n=2 Tax=Candidatus Epulonipiscium fishelsonii TaxID=77094 RepID=A0ACC8XF26_9FIRM|nr:hypothetical protein AN396_09140 [Epulopiscium sp. SCG-B11WGA-EpuloA1]ONI41532.1 hypothetical protein AN639_03545 [Epulopiscium sp. SCG-B05WGA-EpuloA1]ONI41922.1 hypothetical protein AN396_02680 [Epulopiscium sp. SCG-B11WGA-EpuloA1]